MWAPVVVAIFGAVDWVLEFFWGGVEAGATPDIRGLDVGHEVDTAGVVKGKE